MIHNVTTFFREVSEKESSKETELTYPIFYKTIVQFLCYLPDMENCNEWLYLDGRKAPVYYLCGYIPISLGRDTLSKTLLAFKAGNFHARHFWLDQILNSYQQLFTKEGNALIIRSLGHNELDVDLNMDYKNPLGFLSYRLAKAINCRYAAGLIHKKNVTPPLKGLNKEERWKEVKDNFGLSQLFRPGLYNTVWFVDDVITTGATARAIWKALLDFYPDVEFKVIALARTVRDRDYNINSIILNQDISENNLLREEEETYFVNNLKYLKIRFDNTDTFFV